MTEKTILDFLKEEYGLKAIESPLDAVKGTAMVLVSVGGRSLLGSISALTDGLLELYFPLGYMEAPQTNEQGQLVGVNSQMGKEYVLLCTPKWKMVRADSIYFLDSEISQDKKMAVEYDRAITHIRGNDAGIEIASPSNLTGGSVTPLRN